MDRPKLPGAKASSRVKKITIRMPKYMKEDIPKTMIKEGYNFRQKSKWICVAIEAMISRKDWEGALMSQASIFKGEVDVYTIPLTLHEKLTHEVRRLSSEKPFLNPSMASIIRAAIQRRCMGIKF